MSCTSKKSILSRVFKKIKQARKDLVIKLSDDNKFVNPFFYELNPHLRSPVVKDYPKKIWIYWESASDIPEIVKISVDRVRHYCPDYEVIFLNIDTLDEYIDIPQLPDSLPVANKSDFIRLKLLEKFGGVWMDASIILNDGLGWVLDKLTDHDAFTFFSDECTMNPLNPITENWFIVAPKESQFIKDWLTEFSSCIFSDSPTDYYNDIKNDKSIVQNLSLPDYLLCYISAIKVLKSAEYKVLYASSASVGHYFNYKYKFNGSSVATALTQKSESKIAKVKLVKLTADSRNAVELKIGLKKIKSGSYISNVFDSVTDIYSEQ